MHKHFRLQLTIILIVFSLFISGVLTFFDYEKLKEQIRKTHQQGIEMAEETIIDSLATIDKMYHLFDDQTAEKMRKKSFELFELYETMPNFEQWDFQQLKKKYGMDVYIINQSNTIIHSSDENDIGLDFNACCTDFANVLDERRESSEFTHDGIDLQQKSGNLKKYSYLPTSDHQYLIELGIDLQNDRIFQQFDFAAKMNALKEANNTIHSIRIFNSEGYLLVFGHEQSPPPRIDESHQFIFEEALKTGKPKEFKLDKEKDVLTYRYVPYEADEIRGISTLRVVEIVFSDVELLGILNMYRMEYIAQLIIIIITSIGLSFIIAQIVARPIYLAFHDSLTGLKNRESFKNEVVTRLMKKEPITLMMIDLDNFKAVNDQLGHQEGDHVLKIAAKLIQESVGKEDLASRLGGDEFIIIFSKKEKDEVQLIAADLVEKMKETFLSLLDEQIEVSVSIGIAHSTKEDTIDSLYEKADRALYRSKRNGKNQFSVDPTFGPSDSDG